MHKILIASIGGAGVTSYIDALTVEHKQIRNNANTSDADSHIFSRFRNVYNYKQQLISGIKIHSFHMEKNDEKVPITLYEYTENDFHTKLQTINFDNYTGVILMIDATSYASYEYAVRCTSLIRDISNVHIMFCINKIDSENQTVTSCYDININRYYCYMSVINRHEIYTPIDMLIG